MNLDEIFKYKNYCHFDRKLRINNSLKNYILNKSNIERHSFLPFLYFQLEERKMSQVGPKKPKYREIYYCGHFDRYIYQYYNYILNLHYEKYLKSIAYQSLNDSVIAYRKLGYNNIHFAKNAFDFIKTVKRGVVYCFDISKFFDNLDHSILKANIRTILNLPNLPEDMYKVYKSLIKHSWVDRSIALNILNLSEKKIRLKNQLCDIKEFKEAIAKKGLINTNKNNFGIPQGSPMSATLSNIYMLEFDREVINYMKYYNGIYMRYSDDIFISIPYEDKNKTIENLILNLINRIKLPISKEKTE
ncbi:MAG: hypothetical protein GW938_14840 [Leptospira sp.]|nr:hypothetical protein [Leptospira sp.]NCS94384.1 hypothetical protein [Leptospira sp.]